MNVHEIISEANLAPSVHNTQPTCWQVDGNGLILSLNNHRLLDVADPQARDARLSMGTALLGTWIAASRQGFGVKGIDHDRHRIRLELVADNSTPIWEHDTVMARTTFREGFASLPKSSLSGISTRIDTSITDTPAMIRSIAELNDSTSHGIMRDKAFRAELRRWMRLSKRHANWSRDGMNANALGLSRLEAIGASRVLSTPVFECLDKLGVAAKLTGEFSKTCTSHYVIAFHRPEGEDPLDSGVAFYELWLELTQCKQAVWPMAALADDPDARKQVEDWFDVPAGRQLINVLRVGPLPKSARSKTRLPVNELLIQ